MKLYRVWLAYPFVKFVCVRKFMFFQVYRVLMNLTFRTDNAGISSIR